MTIPIKHTRKYRISAFWLHGHYHIHIGGFNWNCTNCRPIVCRGLLVPIVEIRGVIQGNIRNQINHGIFHAVAVSNKFGKSSKFFCCANIEYGNSFSVFTYNHIVFPIIPRSIFRSIPNRRFRRSRHRCFPHKVVVYWA